MKSYSQYIKEQRREQQEKIDAMKPIERLDYFYRIDRVKEENINICARFSGIFIFFSIIEFLFGLLLLAIQTENSLVIYIPIIQASIFTMKLGMCFLIGSFAEFLLRKHIEQEKIKEINSKYNL